MATSPHLPIMFSGNKNMFHTSNSHFLAISFGFGQPIRFQNICMFFFQILQAIKFFNFQI